MLQRVKKLEERMREKRTVRVDELSQDDQDCLDIVDIAMKATAGASPNYHDIEETEAWKHGWELHKRLYPITPVHLDPLYGKLNRCLHVFCDFVQLHGRDPVEGDVLSYADLAAAFSEEVHACMFNELLFEAWQRKIKNLPYPLRSEKGLLYLRTRDYRTGEVTWEEHHEQDHPQHRWRRVEEDLGGDKRLLANARMPITPAVVFFADSQGHYGVKPHIPVAPASVGAAS